MDALLDKSFRLSSNVEVGKFTALVLDTGTYTDGCDVPAAANEGQVLGIAQESILPNSVNDYSGGVYQITSGTAWPSNSIPSSATGRAISVRCLGISRAVAYAAITAGAHVNIADSAGRIKEITEVAGTLVHELGWALEAATAQGDVIRIMVLPIDRHT